MKIDWELLLALAVTAALITLAGLVFFVGISNAQEPACPSIKAVMVPPQAVVHQPDGDTFHLFTFDVPSVVKIRVKDAETPERGQAGYEEAKEVTREWLARGPFRVITCGVTTFDRVVGDVVRGNERLADVLKAAGYWREDH